MPHKTRFGVIILQNLPWAELVKRCKYYENIGLDSVWVGDHFVNPARPQQAWFDGWTALSGLAACTSTIRLGTLVSSITLRNPALLARQAMTLDHISNGRLELGIGSAGAPLDHSMLGINQWDLKERFRRYRECVEIVDHLLRGNVTTYEGTYYKIKEAIVQPPPMQKPRPPLTLAAHGNAALRLVAEYADSWVSFGLRPLASVPLEEAVKITQQRNERLSSYCSRAGRKPEQIVRSFLLSGFPTGTPFTSVDEFRDIIARFEAIGINEFIFNDQHRADASEIFERVMSEVIRTKQRGS